MSDGIGIGTPGRLTPLCALTSPPTMTRHRARPARPPRPQPHEPVVDQHVVPRPRAPRRSRPARSGARRSWDASSPTTSISSPLHERARRRDLADAQLRPLEVGDQRDRPAELGLHRAHDAAPRRVVLVRAVREVEARGVHPGLRECANLLGRRRDGADRRHDLRSATLSGHAAQPTVGRGRGVVLPEDEKIDLEADDAAPPASYAPAQMNSRTTTPSFAGGTE